MKKASSPKSKKKKIAILGFGREGKSILKFFQNRGRTRNDPQKYPEITILDKNPKLKKPASHHPHLKISHRLGKSYLNNLKRFDIIFRSPGIPYTLPQLYRARCKGTDVTSATKLFFEQLRGSARNSGGLTRKNKIKIIGVTGTKGKGTVATLIYKILKAAHKKVFLAGNIGKPMLEILKKLKNADCVVLELSSFQLQDLPYSPDIAVILDIFPDHLDQHKSLREYYGSKANIGRFQKKGDAVFYFADNKLSKTIALESPAKRIPVAAPSTLERNKIMAAAVAKKLGLAQKIIEKTLKNFRGIEHRLELVKIIRLNQRPHQRQSASILFYNDSAATNPESAAMAIRTLSHVAQPMPLILIAGGKDKGLNYAPLAREIKKSQKVKAVILFGENRKRIKNSFRIKNPRSRTNSLRGRHELRIMECRNLKDVVSTAYTDAKKLINQSTNKSIKIVFSPASASFDMFQNYAHRGEQFKKIVNRIKYKS